jgi:hypothetical protein
VLAQEGVGKGEEAASRNGKNDARNELGVKDFRLEDVMPEKETMERAEEDLREGKSPTTAAGEFVHEEIEHVREGKHGARSPKQAIAIGLSKARRAGIPLEPPKRGRTSDSTRQKAEKDYERGQKDPQTTEKARRAAWPGRRR